jgi:hypothetical protein
VIFLSTSRYMKLLEVTISSLTATNMTNSILKGSDDGARGTKSQ